MTKKTERPKQPTASFVVVANRLPVDRVENADGSTSWRTSPGGLVSAFEPIMRKHDGAWIGWVGAPDEELDAFHEDDMDLVPVRVSASELELYYEGFSNATLWPLYHDVIAHPQYQREWWDAYVEVNQRFADRTAEVAEPEAVVWVQDYQLQLVPQMLRAQRPDLKIGFFLHIPFPPTELFDQLPWRNQILDGLLGADLIGFQLPGGAQNFVRLVRRRLRLTTKRNEIHTAQGRRVVARAYPISIDAEVMHELAIEPKTEARAHEIRHDLGDPEVLFLGVDRLDYTKGLAERIRAFGELVESGDIDIEKVAFIQVATPSRERVEEYRQLRDDLERLIGRINGDLGRVGRVPITYLHASYPREEMVALYRAADVMIVTPLRDGMNLVAKEFVACRNTDDGALVLSEFAGAAHELRQAYLVNPYDIDGLKATMLEALHDPPRIRARRMRALRKQVFTYDINRWANSFLADLDEVTSGDVSRGTEEPAP